MREREGKLCVSSSFEIPEGPDLAKGVVSSAPESVVQHAVYFDTPDLRLTRSGVSVRFRSDDGWTVKLPVERDSSRLVRMEHSFAGAPTEPPAGALSLVRAFTRSAPVLEVATIDTHRRRISLTDASGKRPAEVDDDDVAGRPRTGPTTRFREVEVELAPDAPDRFLDRTLRVLRRRGAQSCPVSKIERVLGDDARAPSDIPEQRSLTAHATVAEVVRYSLIRSLRQLVTLDPHLRSSEDPEAVHKTRVATRRLRSDLRTLRPVLVEGRAEPLRDELKWLGTMLGRVRDADVLLSALAANARRLPSAQRRDVETFAARLRHERARDRAALLEALDSERYTRLLDDLIAAASEPPVADDAANTRARKLAQQLLARPRRRLRRGVRRIGPQPDDPHLHEVRKHAKQARYAHEMLAPVLGKSARKATRRYEAIQEVLGDHQDAVVATAWVTEAAQATDQTTHAFVAGMLGGLFLSDREAARAEWPKTWKRARNVRVG